MKYNCPDWLAALFATIALAFGLANEVQAQSPNAAPWLREALATPAQADPGRKDEMPAAVTETRPTGTNQVATAKALSSGAPTKPVNAGADEQTPSRAQYFSWLNNSNEGSTERQTLINLAFFKWLREEYGMQLDIYAWDAGNLDGAGSYRTMDAPQFKAAYPRGWRPVADSAATFGCRLGLWGGPDGYGHTPQEEQARRELLVRLCRDYHFALFKWDAVCGALRPEKQEAAVQTLEECRQYSPDLIVLNHRLELGQARPYVTTWLWEGAETYIDVHLPNSTTAPHHRAGAISRGLTPQLQRLTEDHGVCLSSCLDYWEDDLVLQAFNRSLILAPEIYGNPWLLRDDEFPKLARLFNLHRRYGNILVKGMVLPEGQYGPNAVARGDQATRFITLRNLSWKTVTYQLQLDQTIGLTQPGQVEVRRFHPHETILGRFERGTLVPVEVPPFRSCLIMATTKPCGEVGVSGCDAEVERDVAGRPVMLKLLGMPGTTAKVTLQPGRFTFSQATIDGQSLEQFGEGKPVEIMFPGTPLAQPWHRKLADLEACPVPDDAEALYEATCFAADNDALEVRSLRRSGATAIPAVQKARDAFFAQPLFSSRGCWDRLLFDGDITTAFAVTRDTFRGCGDGAAVSQSAQLRLDLGAQTPLDQLVIRVARGTTTGEADYSSDLTTWTKAQTLITNDAVAIIPHPGQPVRYVRIARGSMAPAEVEGTCAGRPVRRELWRASNLFDSYASRIAESAWSATVRLDQAAPGSYLCIALDGEHGKDGAWVAARLDGKPIGCPDRAPSFDSNMWEHGVANCQSNYTYYLPITPAMLGRKLDLVALTLKGGKNAYKPTVWITTQNPFVAREVVLK
jgi:hypothetical protein